MKSSTIQIETVSINRKHVCSINEYDIIGNDDESRVYDPDNQLLYDEESSMPLCMQEYYINGNERETFK
jgi:hypothetical protein